MNVAIILAGGVGSRMGMDIPKQFVNILGKPIIAYTIEEFQKNAEIDVIEIVCIETYIEYCKNVVDKYNLSKVKWIVSGGNDFQHSVMNGIDNLKDKISNEDIVLIHFGASPFVSQEIISDSIRICKNKGNAISTTPFYLLAGLKDNEEYSTTYIDRETVVCMNSPHTFKYGIIKDIYKEAIEKNLIDKVEPHTTSLMYKLNKPIYFSKGSQVNIKLTTKEDLKLFEGYVMTKNNHTDIQGV